MPRLYLPQSEPAYERRVLFAVELVDPVTLGRVSRDVTVSAPPLRARPVVNYSGRYVWLVEGAGRPTTVIVEPDPDLPYDREEQPAPDLDALAPGQRLLRVLLHPRRDYVFPDGVSVVRGQLNETAGAPPVRVLDAQVWLQWRESDSGHWNDEAAPVFSRTRANGEFAAFLRLGPAAAPKLDGALRMTVRLRVRRPGAPVRSGPPILVPQAAGFRTFQTLAWDQLQ